MLDHKKMLKRIRGLTNQRVQVKDQGFFTDEEVLDFMQQNWNVLYNKMVDAREHYFKKDRLFTLLNGEQIISIGEDFYKVLKVDYLYSENRYITCDEVDLREENRYENRGSYLFDHPVQRREDDRSTRAYIICNVDSLKMIPRERVPGKYRVYFVPICPDLVLPKPDPNIEGQFLEGEFIDNPNINIPRGFENLVIYDSAIDIGIPEEGDLKNLMIRREQWMKNIEDWMSQRGSLQPKRIYNRVDFEGRSQEGFYFDDVEL